MPSWLKANDPGFGFSAVELQNLSPARARPVRLVRVRRECAGIR
jgi:hypothetical protein